MLPFLFLDFDGVLNNNDFLKRAWAGRTKEQVTEAWLECPDFLLDPVPVRRLNRIVGQVSFVLSSSWYPFHSFETCQRALAGHGFLGTLDHVTPKRFLSSKDEEIADFLSERGISYGQASKQFVILDDEPLFWFQQNQIRTDDKVGLTDLDIYEVARRLGLSSDPTFGY